MLDFCPLFFIDEEHEVATCPKCTAAWIALGNDAEPDLPWCSPCGSWHMKPHSAVHHAALRCRAPFPPVAARMTP